MEQLTSAMQLAQSRGRLLEVAMLMKKVVVKLSSIQMDALGNILRHYLVSKPVQDMMDKAEYYHIYVIYEKKIRPKQLDLKQSFKLKLDVAQAVALWYVLINMGIREDLIFECTVADYIISEIEHQTV